MSNNKSDIRSRIKERRLRMKAKHGTELSKLGIFTDTQLDKLFELSIVTAEEFVATAFSEQEALAKYLGLPEEEVAHLRKRVTACLPPEIAKEIQTPVKEQYSLGALDPRRGRKKQ